MSFNRWPSLLLSLRYSFFLLSSCLILYSKAFIFMTSCSNILFSFCSFSILTSTELISFLTLLNSYSLILREVSWFDICCLSCLICTSALFRSSKSLFPSTILLFNCSFIWMFSNSRRLWSSLSASFSLLMAAISCRLTYISCNLSLIDRTSCSLLLSILSNCSVFSFRAWLNLIISSWSLASFWFCVITLCSALL